MKALVYTGLRNIAARNVPTAMEMTSVLPSSRRSPGDVHRATATYAGMP
jgi:hypothetical protein